MTPGRFAAGELTFALDDGWGVVELADPVELALEDFDAVLHASGRVPELGGAPLASWVLARLAALAGGRLGLLEEGVELCEGAVFVVDFVVAGPAGPVGKVQVQGGAIGVGLLGVVEGSAEAVAQALRDALLGEPEVLASYAVAVAEPGADGEPGPVFRYGWDGARFLRGE